MNGRIAHRPPSPGPRGRRLRMVYAVGAMAMLAVAPAPAQTPAASADTVLTLGPWRRMLVHEGLLIEYLFHRDAKGDDASGNGVVLKLTNANDYGVGYRFVVIFRAPGREAVEEEVVGTLRPREAKTGSAEGLFWIPYADGVSVGEVGLRGYRVRRLPADASLE